MKKRKLVDLYHCLSRALFFDMESSELIDGDEAVILYNKIDHSKAIGYLKHEQGIKADVWKDGKPTTISGRIFEI